MAVQVETQGQLQEFLEILKRRKWVVNHVNSRHKGLTVPEALATKSDAEFQVAASKQLHEFLKHTELTRSSDVKTMEYYERACREQEVPLRKEWFVKAGEEARQMPNIFPRGDLVFGIRTTTVGFAAILVMFLV